MTHRFDTLTRSFATKLSRRTAMHTTSAGIAVGLVSTTGRSAMAQDATSGSFMTAGGDTASVVLDIQAQGQFPPQYPPN